jgi:Ca-activated chloride channel homolog
MGLFVHPYLLLLAAIVPVIFYLAVRKKRKAIPFPGISLAKDLPRVKLLWLPPLMLSLAALCLIAAAARPRVAQGMEETKIVGVDVALAIDLSGSMRAEDLKPNRIEAAKATLKEFVKGFNQGRLALVAFAGRSFTQCPLTSDGNILTGLLDQLDVGSVQLDGTAIGDAIINCINKFKEKSASRIIILLTDGENNSGSVDPITAARAAAERGIKIYAIGIGTPEGAPIPVYGPDGRKDYLRDEFGHVLIDKADFTALKKVAELTGGRYFEAKDDRALKDIYGEISRMEKKELTVKRTRGYRELFPYPAGAGFVLLALGGSLMAWRRRLS